MNIGRKTHRIRWISFVPLCVSICWISQTYQFLAVCILVYVKTVIPCNMESDLGSQIKWGYLPVTLTYISRWLPPLSGLWIPLTRKQNVSSFPEVTWCDELINAHFVPSLLVTSWLSSSLPSSQFSPLNGSDNSKVGVKSWHCTFIIRGEQGCY